MLTNQSNSVSLAGEQRYRHLFENMPVCIFVVDLTASPALIMELNRQAELVYGYQAAELVGKPAVQLVPEESRESVQDILQQVQRGERINTTTTNRRRDGTTFPVRIVATLDPTDNGHMLIAVEDITAEQQRRSEVEAIDSERLRIAHEMHDSVAQNLAGLRFKSALWLQLADSASPAMQAALDELQAVLTAAIENIRRAIFALRPVDLESLGFFPALKQLVTNFGDQNQLVAQLEVSEPQTTLPLSYELPLFRIIQEGLNNITQHARASSVLVRYNVDTAGVVGVSLRDNGCGFDTHQLGTSDHSGHFGLRQMRERILDLGGSLDIHSAPGQGTELLISLPLLGTEIANAAS